MSSKPQGAGSIWNPNSWHWEMKNYTEVSKQLIQQKTLSLDIKDQTFVLTNNKVRFVKAESQVSIRKGKQHLVYQFEIEVDFSAKHRSQLVGGQPIEGTYTVKQIASDDLSDIAIDNVKTASKGEQATKVKNFLKKYAKNYFVQLFQTLAEDLAKLQGDPQKLQEDKKKREQATMDMIKAKEERGEEKERLLEEQKKREIQMKSDFAKQSQKDQ